MEKNTYKECSKFYLTSPLDVVIEWNIPIWR